MCLLKSYTVYGFSYIYILCVLLNIIFQSCPGPTVQILPSHRALLATGTYRVKTVIHCFKNASKISLEFREGTDAMCLVTHIFAILQAGGFAENYFKVHSDLVCTTVQYT